MDKMQIGQHISQRFNQELEEIRNRVLLMGGLVEEQLTKALSALVNNDVEMAKYVVAADMQVDALEVSIDSDCTHVLARRQPAASDLRLIMAVIKTIADLERIGDEAERVGRMALHLTELGWAKVEMVAVEHLGNHVKQMLHDALDAFARLDVETAIRVAKEDLKVDKEYESLMRQLITFMMEDPRSIPRVLDVIWSARALERIGDRSRNICQYVIYLVKGQDVRHFSLENIERTVSGER